MAVISHGVDSSLPSGRVKVPRDKSFQLALAWALIIPGKIAGGTDIAAPLKCPSGVLTMIRLSSMKSFPWVYRLCNNFSFV